MKLGYIFAAIVLLLVCLISFTAIYRLIFPPVQDTEEEFSDYFAQAPELPFETKKDEDYISVLTESGDTVEIYDVTKFAFAVNHGDGLYNLPDPEISNRDFNIGYSANNNSFTVSINNINNLDSTIESATKEIMYLSQTNSEDVCKLNTYVGVTFEVSPELSGIDYGLSYCRKVKPEDVAKPNVSAE